MRRPGPWTAVSIGLAGQPGAGPAGRVVDAAGHRPAHQARSQPLRPLRGGPGDPDAAATAGAATARAQAATAAAPGGGSVPGPSVSGTSGCNDIDGTNVRVNQECTNQSGAAFLGRGQGQNETGVAVNPRNPRHLLVGQNDYRRGDGACGADWSQDGGRHWGSELAPLSFTAPGITGGARHYWDASGDPSVAFDSSGEAYLFCLAFNRGAPVSDSGLPASGLFVFRSASGGASWKLPGSPVKQSDGSGSDSIGLLDKPYMAVDTSKSSRFRDRLYVAWAEYNVNFSADPIGFAWSDDHGATWNLVPAISGASAALCPVNFEGRRRGPATPTSSPSPSPLPTATCTWSSRTSTTA